MVESAFIALAFSVAIVGIVAARHARIPTWILCAFQGVEERLRGSGKRGRAMSDQRNGEVHVRVRAAGR